MFSTVNRRKNNNNNNCPTTRTDYKLLSVKDILHILFSEILFFCFATNYNNRRGCGRKIFFYDFRFARHGDDTGVKIIVR